MCDFLWSDPMSCQDAENGDWADNGERGNSFYYGLQPVKKLFKKNALLSIFRGHQV